MDEGFSEARVLAEISLLPDKIRVASGRRAVAMATGVIDRYYKDGTPQKQVLVVVTSGWSVLCFDHNLKKLWETNLQVFYLLRSLSNVPHKSLPWFSNIDSPFTCLCWWNDRRISHIMHTIER